MEMINGGSANSGQVGRKLSLDDKVVIMWVLDSLADNTMPYVKEIRSVIHRQTKPNSLASAKNSGGVAARIANAIRVSKGVSPEFLVWMREDQSRFVKGVVKVMMWLSVDRYYSDKVSAKSRCLDEYKKCGAVLDKF
ncbi:hypothetical protein MCERE19_02281 [Spirosomataceae bacterium]